MFEISSAQRDKLLTDGFVGLEGAIPSELLERWRHIADACETRALEAHAQGLQLPGACVINDLVGPRLMRQDDLLALDTEALMDLLACPAMMAVMRELCGRGCVPLQSDVLFKHQHPHPVIQWHQGAQHARTHSYLNVGIYLDDAPEGDGCLSYVPGTHHGLQDIQGLSERHGWHPPGAVFQPAKAGDILVQDMMVLHGSQPKRSPGCRRTLYVELRPADGIVVGQEQSERWVALRKAWMAHIVDRAADDDWPLDWRDDLPTPPPLPDLVQQIVRFREPPIPAVYAVHPVEHDDYPVPADLRSPPAEGT